MAFRGARSIPAVRAVVEPPSTASRVKVPRPRATLRPRGDRRAWRLRSLQSSRSFSLSVLSWSPTDRASGIALEGGARSRPTSSAAAADRRPDVDDRLSHAAVDSFTNLLVATPSGGWRRPRRRQHRGGPASGGLDVDLDVDYLTIKGALLGESLPARCRGADGRGVFSEFLDIGRRQRGWCRSRRRRRCRGPPSPDSLSR